MGKFELGSANESQNLSRTSQRQLCANSCPPLEGRVLAPWPTPRPLVQKVEELFDRSKRSLVPFANVDDPTPSRCSDRALDFRSRPGRNVAATASGPAIEDGHSLTSPPSAEAGYRNGRGAWLPPDRSFTALHRRAYGPSLDLFRSCEQASLRRPGRSPSGTVRHRRRFPHSRNTIGGRMC
jgi:hypothetical protein